MKNTKNVLIKHSGSINPWSIYETQEADFISVIEGELFTIHADIRKIVIKAVKTTCFMIKENNLQGDAVVFEFVNYVLGTLFKEMPEFYLATRGQVFKNLPRNISYNLNTLDQDREKLFPNHKAEYDFVFESNSTSKKVS